MSGPAARKKETRTVRVLLVDDHPFFRRGVAQVLADEGDLEVCGEAGTIAEAVELVGQRRPDISIVDVSLPDGSGLDLIRMLRQKAPDARVLVLSMHAEDLVAEFALDAGAHGYLEKDEDPEVLVEAIRCVLKEQFFLSRSVTSRVLGAARSDPGRAYRPPIERLTERELLVFELIGQGLNTRDIADRLCLSVKTVETYRTHIRDKLQLKDASRLIFQAVLWSLARAGESDKSQSLEP